MRQFRLATIITAVAMAAVGCSRESGPDGSSSRVDPDRPATRVLRPDEVKISLGPETPAKAASAATDPAAASKSSAP